MILLNAIRNCSKTDSNHPAYKLPFKMTYCLARNIRSLTAALEPAQEFNRQIFEGWPQESAAILERRAKSEGRDAREEINAEHSAAFALRNDRWKSVLAEEIEVEIYPLAVLNEEESKQLAQSGLPATIIADLEPIGIFDAIEI